MTAMRAVPFTAVAFDDGFWAPRQAAVRDATIPFLHRQYEKAGIFAALDVRAPADPLPIAYEVTPIGTKPATPVMYWDSDIGKWIEAAAYTLATQRDAQLEAVIDDIVARIEAAQEPDGYFNSYFQRRAPEAKWSNLRDWHELYCAGHLMEGAVAYAAATGKRRAAGRDVPLCRPDRAHLRSRRGPAPRLLRSRGDRAGAGQAGALHRRDALHGSGALLHRRTRPPAALLRRRGAGARQRSGRLVSPHLRIQPVARSGARAGQGGGPRGARDVSVFGDGGPGSRGCRPGPARRLCPAVARSDREAAVCHRRSRAVLDQ